MADKKIKKAIIAAAGFGTRFLPTTKVMQKEMIPILNAPIIHYSVQEVINSGVEEIIIVTREGKTQINEYFAKNSILEDHLKKQGKMHYLSPFEELYSKAKITIIKQDESLPYGNGSPLLSAKKYVSPGEDFFYLYSDDIVNAKPPCCLQLLNLYNTYECRGVLGVQKVSKEETKLYGIIKLKDNTDLPYVERIIEKPDPSEAPSCLASFGRYLMPYTLFDHLSPEKTGKDGELWMADAVHRLLEKETILSCEIDGEWLTTGDPINLFKANLAMALEFPEYKEGILSIIKEML
ncbi:MAG: UTP--glucose-1-phosphate uridylyltransferase [Spirochaetales bacterium]|nr:UTP--glucose-1-phosphate uridylyltransferase [Spirochaetales bacterium]